MAQWSIVKADGTDTKFVDSQTAMPGEEGFSTAEVKAKAGKLQFNFLGQSPDYVPAQDEPEEVPNAD